MLTYSFYEGDIRVIRYATALANRGDSVDVIALRREGQSKRDVVDGVNVFRIQGRQPNNAQKWSYALEVLLFFFRAMTLITRRHFQASYQFVHVHSIPDFLVFSAWVPALTGAKVILDIHDLLPELYASKYGVKHGSFAFRVMIGVERISCAFAHHVIAANDLWQQRLAERSAPAGKCTAFVNLPDREMFCRRGRTRTDKEFIILYPGTLNWHQGLDIALRAFAKITNDAPEARFHIYGEGPCQGELVELAQKLNLQERVVLKPYIATRDIVPIMENADLGIVAKRKNGFGNEAFSTKIMEFMALGVPVLIADTDVDRYYFNDSIVKFFRAEDEDDLAASMLQLIKQPEMRSTLAQNALGFVERNCWDSKKTEYLALVDGLVKKTYPSDKRAPIADRT